MPDEMGAQFITENRSQTTHFPGMEKTIRSTDRMKTYAALWHIISAQICELGITLASETVQPKSNEFLAVQKAAGKNGY